MSGHLKQLHCFTSTLSTSSTTIDPFDRSSSSTTDLFDRSSSSTKASTTVDSTTKVVEEQAILALVLHPMYLDSTTHYLTEAMDSILGRM